ncbi:hypothetical protein CLOM_g20549 [Closterium sp. NIES-68]|nr:hypothetical protein CLOM_g20549 [Closterium sp. NIES-68]GJP83559.1 hypothetical protein CLOP_g13693 [Closterium sp. NIES-67]
MDVEEVIEVEEVVTMAKGRGKQSKATNGRRVTEASGIVTRQAKTMTRCSVTESKGGRKPVKEDNVVEAKGRGSRRAKAENAVDENGGSSRAKENGAVALKGAAKRAKAEDAGDEKGGSKRAKENGTAEAKMGTKRAKVNNGRSVSRVEAPRQPKDEKAGKEKPPRQLKGGKGEAASLAKKQPGKARKRGKAPAVDDDLIQVKQAPLADSEETAIVLTQPSDAATAAASAVEKKPPVRQLLDFAIHDADGAIMPLDSIDALAARGEGLFATGVILPETAALRHMEGYRCEAFGPIEGWYIDGYERASTAARIMITTDAAVYVCCRPAGKSKKDFTALQDKANLCVEVFRALSKPDGGDPSLSLPEVIARVSRALGRPCRDELVEAHGFVAQQLCGLDEDADQDDQLFSGLPALESLKEEGAKQAAVRSILAARQASTKETAGKKHAANNGALVIRDTAGGNSSSKGGGGASGAGVGGMDDEELARLVAEEEEKEAEAKRGGGRRKGAGGGGQERYLKINEKELADDYPPPRYYKSVDEETDEFLLFDDSAAPMYPEDLPRRRLDDWALYDDQLRFVSLELLPMLPGVSADSLVFGSGVMMEDDGSGFSLDDPTVESAGTRGGGSSAAGAGSSGGAAEAGGSSGGGSGASGSGSGSGSDPAAADGGGGIRVYLSAIKEWMIEFGAGMLFVTIRTDGAWYRLGRPSAAYVPWYRPVLRTARLAIRVIEMLSGESRAARLSFLDVVTRLAQEWVEEKREKSGKEPARGDLAKCFAEMERFLVVHGNIILQQFREYPVETIRRSPFISTLRGKMEMRSHTELKVSRKKAAIVAPGRGGEGRGGGGGSGGSARNANPAAALRPDASKRKPMRATTTQLVHRIWKEYYERFGLKRDEPGAGKEGGEREANGKVEGEEGGEVVEEEEEEGGELLDGDSEDEEEVVEVANVSKTKGGKEAGKRKDKGGSKGGTGSSTEGSAAKENGVSKMEVEAEAGANGDTRKDVVKKADGESKTNGAEVGTGSETKEEVVKTKGRAVRDSTQGVAWVGASTGRTEEDHPAFAAASVWGLEVRSGTVVLAAVGEGEEEEGGWREERERVVIVEYMWDEGGAGAGARGRRRGEGMKAHGRVMVRGSETVLGNAADEWEVFVSEHCVDFPLTAIREKAAVTHRQQPWGAEHRLRNMEEDDRERARMEKLFKETGQRSFFYRFLYNPSRGGFFDLPKSLGSGTGRCCSCDEDMERDGMMEVRRLGDGEAGFAYLGKEFHVGDFVFMHPAAVGEESDGRSGKLAKGGRNIGLRAWPIGQIEKFVAGSGKAKEVPEQMVVRRFFRPEDVPSEGDEMAYTAHIREVYYSETLITVDVTDVIGKCRVQRGKPTAVAAAAAAAAAAGGTGALDSVFNIGGCLEEELLGGDFVFFCDRLLKDGSVRMLPPGIRFCNSAAAAAASPTKDKGKGKSVAAEDADTDAAAARARAKGKGKAVVTDDADTDAAAAEAAAARARAKGKGKAVEETEDSQANARNGKQLEASSEKQQQRQEGEQGREASSKAGVLQTLDIFAGCGGLSEGLHRSGVCETKWAIEYEHPAAEAFGKNHPEAAVICNNCNVVLRCMMEQAGQLKDCVSTPEANEAASKMAEGERGKLPLPGQVDFVNGGPPCQGFSGMNRFNQNPWSKVQCEMILAFLSFADFLRPSFFLLENVRNFVSFNGARTFRLALRTLLAMGYQVRFGVLQAGNFGISQSRTRAFIWAAAPGQILPEWPQPLHVFASSQLSVPLGGSSGSSASGSNVAHFSTAASLANEACPRGPAVGAPLRSITVRDAMGELPSIENGAEEEEMEYSSEPSSWFQRCIRAQQAKLLDHTCKRMNELNLKRCQHIPRRPGADWRDLPDIKVRLSDGREADLVPWCLPNTMQRHNNWKGLFGRLDWAGNFPTSVTDPQPMGKVGMCFHPEQDRIVSVRECARSQGFPDGYRFAGNIQAKHRQIGNAVPPPLALALGLQLKKALMEKRKMEGAQEEGERKCNEAE